MALPAPPSVPGPTTNIPGPTTNIRDVDTTLAICESNVRGSCSQGDQCDYHHYTLPYLWQLQYPPPIAPRQWHNLDTQQSEAVEKAYCDMLDSYQLHMKLTAPDGSVGDIAAEINFNVLQAQLTSPIIQGVAPIVPMRRLSTPSYVRTVQKYGSDIGEVKYHTQWRWYWWSDSWKMFNSDSLHTPSQYALESKYLDEQEIYRFVINSQLSTATKTKTPEMVFLLYYQHMRMTCLNDKNTWKVKRRPLFVGVADVGQGKHVCNPPIKPCLFLSLLPDNWHPIDTDQQCELIPLNPETMSYHLVASEFHSSLPQESRVIHDIFRLQNPLLYNQYSTKKKWMENRSHVKSPELLLFHGTTDDAVVQAICRDNFDWRVCGKNNTVYGRGSYFAKHAAYSDRYAKRGAFIKWMFMARVLVGRYTKGSSDLVRPPPVDAAFPLGELYDSCVDKTVSPTIYVVFDKDQCYPEYLISYR